MTAAPRDPNARPGHGDRRDGEGRDTGWIREEMRRAAERRRSLPAWARPTWTRPLPAVTDQATHTEKGEP